LFKLQIMRSGCNICSGGGSVEKFHGAKHQRVEKRKNNFLKDNYMIIMLAIIVAAYIYHRKN